MRAAGGVVLRRGDGGRLEVLAVHRPRYDDWSLPKGKLDDGETSAAAAVRELREETGCECALGSELPTVRYRDRRGRPKEVRFWTAEVVEDHGFAPSDEVDDRRWVPAGSAATLLTYAADRDLVELARLATRSGNPGTSS